MTAEDETEKDRLERDKLQLEIKDLQRTWYFKHVQFILAIVVGGVGMVFALSTGLFDVKKATLTLEKAQLEYDVKVFGEKKADLDTTIHRLTLRNDSLLVAGMSLREENRRLNDDLLVKGKEVAVAKAALLPEAQRAYVLAKAIADLEREHARRDSAQTMELNNSMAWKYGMEKQLGHFRERIANLERDTAALREVIRVKSLRPGDPGAHPPWPPK